MPCLRRILAPYTSNIAARCIRWKIILIAPRNSVRKRGAIFVRPARSLSTGRSRGDRGVAERRRAAPLIQSPGAVQLVRVPPRLPARGDRGIFRDREIGFPPARE